MRTAVLFLVFNRPGVTRRVFETIRAVKPPRLYVSADGPRSNYSADPQLCVDVRTIATQVDWPCEVKTQFHLTNLGCKLGEASGMNWFFRYEEEGIILEDDTLPTPGFFQFCEELLEHYRDNERVFSISGNSYLNDSFSSAESYVFSNYADYWGWAGWRRSWRSYDVNMANWPAWRDADGLRTISGGNVLFEEYWEKKFNDAHAGKIDTWDYQRLFTMWQHNGVSILPSHNMVRNLGFGIGATHTKRAAPAWLSGATIKDPEFPLIHPAEVTTKATIDSYLWCTVYDINRFGAFKRLFTQSHLAAKYRVWRDRRETAKHV